MGSLTRWFKLAERYSMGFRLGLLTGQPLINAMLFASVTICMACSIIMLKKSDIGIILKHASKEFYFGSVDHCTVFLI
jgi:hypothetical protein